MYYQNFGNFQSPQGVSSYDQIYGNRMVQNQQNYYPTSQSQPQPQQAQTNITFVNGIEGAKAFQLSPNSSVLLMDSDNSKFYVKVTDSLGVAKITSYSFMEDSFPSQGVLSTAETVQPSSPSDSDEIADLKDKVSSLEDRLKDLASKLGETI